MRRQWQTRLGLVAAASAALLAVTLPGAAAQAAEPGGAAAAVAGWTLLDRTSVSSLTSGQGVATVTGATGGTSVRYRGVGSIPLSLLLRGWSHIGDPDSHAGYFVDAYQGPSNGTSKMFRVSTPAGRVYEYVHQLAAGEVYHNSFAAISPDGQWLVAGEWNLTTRLLVFPNPILNPATPPTGGALALAGYLTLDRPVRDLQGCDFVTAARLVCSSDDPTGTLSPTVRPLVQVDLPAPLAGGSTGQVSDLGPIPQQSPCSGTFEAEGIDYDPAAGQLRVLMIPPSVCAVVTDVYRYQAA